MRIFNSDGTEPEMCGNGIRCLAKFVAARDQSTAAQYTVHTNGGETQILDESQQHYSIAA